MAITRISEFTFGFAFLFEQAERTWKDLIAAPVLPSLKQEEEEGWDAKLPTKGTEYYYQFKISDYLWGGHAKFRRPGPDKTYDAPYFRIALHRQHNNQQHNRLRALAGKQPHTYYVAPEIVDLTRFNDIFLGRQITNASRLIPVAQCKDYTDSAQHYITYQPGNVAWNEHSEVRRHERSERGEDIEELYRRDAQSWRLFDRGYAIELFESTRNTIVHDLDRRFEERRDNADLEIERETVLRVVESEPAHTRPALVRRAAELVSIYFGATMVIVGRPPTVKGP